ncbi:MAG: transporter [Alphaproteobacteria bacterium]|nr:transporter [Alphaproteobacteria bacterium]
MNSKRSLWLYSLAASAFSILAFSPGFSYARESASSPTADVERLVEELRAQKESLTKKERELDEALLRAEALLDEEMGQEQEPKHLAMMSGRGPQEVGTDRKSKRQQKPEVPAVAVSSGGVLLPKGRIVLEPSLQYSRSSALRVAIEGYTLIPAINVGLFNISDIDRDIVTASLTARAGLTNRLEVEFSVPYLWRDDSSVSRPIGVGATTDVISNVDGNGLGDIEMAAHYQINNGAGGWPFFIGNLRYKSTTGEGPFDVPIDPATGLQAETPTGSGFHALQPSLTMLYPSDPAVFFTNVGYTWNIEDDVGGGNGDIDPGDSINFGLGMGFSINDKTSFSLGYSHSVVLETEQNGVTLPNSDVLQVGSTSFGYSYQINERVGLNFNVAAGVTDDAPDMQVTLRVPVKFDLF